MRNFALTNDEKRNKMPSSFVHMALMAVLMGIMETCFVLCGLYLILSKQTMTPRPFAPNQPVRRLGGYILLFLAVSYLYSSRLIPYIPNWGSGNSDLWVPYLNQDTLLYMIIVFPAFIAFIFRMVEKLKIEQWITITVPTILPLILFIDYCIHPTEIIYYSSLTFWATYTILMVALYIRKMIIYERSLREQHSDIENRELWRFFYPAGLFIITMALGFIAGIYRDSYILLSIYFIFNILSTLSLVWAVDNLQGESEEETGNEKQETEEFPEEDEFTQRRFITIEEALNKELEKQAFFLDPNLSIEHLARMIGTNRTYLGQYFHSKGINFYAYINTLRVNYAIELMEQGGKTLSEIALGSGYNSLRTFRRVFIEQKGCAPSEWEK